MENRTIWTLKKMETPKSTQQCEVNRSLMLETNED